MNDTFRNPCYCENETSSNSGRGGDGVVLLVLSSGKTARQKPGKESILLIIQSVNHVSFQ